MPLSNPDSREEIAPRKSPLHKRMRRRNWAIVFALAAMMVIFYLVTVVRIQTGLDAAG